MTQPDSGSETDLQARRAIQIQIIRRAVVGFFIGGLIGVLLAPQLPAALSRWWVLLGVSLLSVAAGTALVRSRPLTGGMFLGLAGYLGFMGSMLLALGS